MLKLLSVNIKWDLFTDRILDLIAKEQPDVLCIQELLDRDASLLEEAFGAPLHKVPMAKVDGMYTRSGQSGLMCVALGSRLPLSDIRIDHYARYHDGTVLADEVHAPYNRLLLSGVVTAGGEDYRIATTHFTWTPHAAPDARQEADLAKFLPLLADLGDFVLCGDLNAPRGMATFAALAERYRDNIPPEYTTSIDPDLHRLKGTKHLMIDGLFSTPEYRCSDVALRFGVSDHAAISAQIEKV